MIARRLIPGLFLLLVRTFSLIVEGISQPLLLSLPVATFLVIRADFQGPSKAFAFLYFRIGHLVNLMLLERPPLTGSFSPRLKLFQQLFSEFIAALIDLVVVDSAGNQLAKHCSKMNKRLRTPLPLACPSAQILSPRSVASGRVPICPYLVAAACGADYQGPLDMEHHDLAVLGAQGFAGHSLRFRCLAA